MHMYYNIVKCKAAVKNIIQPEQSPQISYYNCFTTGLVSGTYYSFYNIEITL